jgi:hypothetical protein
VVPPVSPPLASDALHSESLGEGSVPSTYGFREAAHGRAVPLPRESARSAAAAARPESAHPMTTHLASGAARPGWAEALRICSYG